MKNASPTTGCLADIMTVNCVLSVASPKDCCLCSISCIICALYQKYTNLHPKPESEDQWLYCSRRNRLLWVIYLIKKQTNEGGDLTKFLWAVLVSLKIVCQGKTTTKVCLFIYFFRKPRTVLNHRCAAILRIHFCLSSLPSWPSLLHAPSSCLLSVSQQLYLAAFYLSHSTICSVMVPMPLAWFGKLLLGDAPLGDLNCAA